MNKIFRTQICGVLTYQKQTDISETFFLKPLKIKWYHRLLNKEGWWGRQILTQDRMKKKNFLKKEKKNIFISYMRQSRKGFLFILHIPWSHVEQMMRSSTAMEDSLLKNAQELWRQCTYIVLGLVYICIAHLYERTLKAYFHIMILAFTHRTFKYICASMELSKSTSMFSS